MMFSAMRFGRSAYMNPALRPNRSTFMMRPMMTTPVRMFSKETETMTQEEESQNIIFQVNNKMTTVA